MTLALALALALGDVLRKLSHGRFETFCSRVVT